VITAPEQWQEVKRLLSAALEREPSERSAYLDQVCPEPAVRQEVESLIAAHEQGDTSFLEPRTPEPAKLEAGAKLGSYEIIAPLGAGGMGVVYKAKDTRLQRQVALKVLHPTFTDPDSLVRFRHEAEVLASLSYPNIVTIHEIGQEGDTFYIAMELVDGPLLSDVLQAGPMALGDVFDIATQIATGLAFAHRSGIVHRDLKPKNLVIRRDGLVKILDFGLSKLAPDLSQWPAEKTTALTGPRMILGTADYMSPQQAAGLPLDFRSDQFSFGSVIYEMATGRRPFRRQSPEETLAAIIGEEPEPARLLNHKVPTSLSAIIQRCLRKNPEERYASTDDLAKELKEKREEFSRIGLVHLPSWTLPPLLALLCLVVVGGVWTVGPRLAEWVRGGAPLVQPGEGVKQLAVLPFTNIGDDPATQPFVDGLVEILSSKLSQLEQFQKTLRVVPATDVRHEGIVSAKEARQTFGVNRVITGSVQRTGNRVRMTINLVDPQTLRQLKSKTIDTEVRDISTLQDGVVLETAELLDVRLTSEAKQVLAVGGTTVPNAYDFYAQGVGYLQRYDVAENVDHAISLFKLALEQDNRYALAQAGLGEAYWRKYEQTDDPHWVEDAKKSSAAALRLNNNLAQVYVTLGMIHTGTGDYDQAIRNLERALALDPLDADAYRELANAYEKLGKLNEAESTHLNAIVVRPNYWAAHYELGRFYFRQARYGEAEKEFQTVVELTPDNARGYSSLGAVAYEQKRYEEAATMYEKSVAIKPSNVAYHNLGTLYFYLGRYQDAARNFELAVQMNDRSSVDWHALAAAYQWSAQPDKARAAFQRTAELAEVQLRTNPRDIDALIRLADAYSMLNQSQRAGEMLDRALALMPTDVGAMFQISVVYEQLGDRKRALAYLEKAIKGGYSRDLIERAPSLAKLRLDPRFQGLFGP
jgi:serine/threonine protein kinase/tetratricopeptide (TPR) repeat protein